MAKSSPGPLAGAIAGSIGGATFSHNRFGTYIRRRAIPVTSTTEDALQAKARLTQLSQAWQGLTTPQKAAWNTWATTNPVTGPLGNQQVLTGHLCYIMLNTRLLQTGSTASATPPHIAAPGPLITLTLTGDIGAGDVSAIFTATPTGANDQLGIRACIADSLGINFVENLFRVIGNSAAAQASPYVFGAILEAKFGTPQVGDILHVKIDLLNDQNGQASAPIRAQVAISST